MDLNPKGFVAPFEAFELATFAKEVQADLVVCSMAWLDSEPPTVEEENEVGKAGKSEMDEWMDVRKTLSYWSLRCDPLWGSGVGFVACNRVGREGGEFGCFRSSSHCRQRNELNYILCS